MSAFDLVCMFLRAVLSKRARLAAEKLALRQQLAVLQRSVKRPRLRRRGQAPRSSLLWLRNIMRRPCSVRGSFQANGVMSLLHEHLRPVAGSR